MASWWISWRFVVVDLDGFKGVGVGFHGRFHGGCGGVGGGSRWFCGGRFESIFGSKSLVAGGWWL